MQLLCDTGELVLREHRSGDPLLAAWRIAADDESGAYERWCSQPSAMTYAAYLALRDQADAAATTFAAHAQQQLVA